MIYEDPSGLAAGGLFDGAAFSLDSGLGAFAAGAWYTGLLYKKNAKIVMTDDDGEAYDDAGAYFASRRLLFAVGWDNAGISETLRLKLGFVGQADLSGGAYHSQYLAGKAALPVKGFVFEAAGCVELAEGAGALAGELVAGWLPPTLMKDRLALTARVSSGDAGALGAFIPVTAEEQGDVLRARLSGLSLVRLDYVARPHETLLFSAACAYFFTSDAGAYRGMPAGGGPALGGEFSGRLSWAPFSDLRLGLGCGAFLPSRGGETLWRVELNAALTVF
jgi:hypothetical protein